MSDKSDFNLEVLLKKYALQNAIRYNGKATEKAVLGKVLAEEPALRKKVTEVKGTLAGIVEYVNSISQSTQEEELRKLDPKLLKRKKAVREETITVDGITLPNGFLPLKNVSEKVVMRFAPGPSGPLHIGHGRGAVLNDVYCKSYDGKLILRLEDTNPSKLMPEAYDWIKEDMDWLGVNYHEVVIQSDRFENYYKYARELLEMGHAYICTCDVEDWRRKKTNGQACADRELSPDEHLGRWERMLDGTYKEGEVTYIVKTDLSHPNPAVRDFIGFRIIDEPSHPRTGTKYRVYPLMNFSVATDDHMLGLTHVLRGKDHLNNTYRQGYLYDYLKWPKPEYIHYGWVSIEDTILKTSEITDKIQKGEISNWADVRLGTFRALEKRGIKPEAVRKYWTSVGSKEVDVRFSWDTLYAFNRDIVDKDTPRYFFVPEPVKLSITGISVLEGHAPIHPDVPDRGVRAVKLVSDDQTGIEIFIPGEDWDDLKSSEMIRLKDLCNVSPTGESTLEYRGNDISVLKTGRVRIIQWASATEHLTIELLMPDGTSIGGVGEEGIVNALGELVQFERFGFARIYKSDSPEFDYQAVFCHK